MHVFITMQQKSLVDQMTSTNVNTNIFRMLGQHWTETTYVDEANMTSIRNHECAGLKCTEMFF
jgi:hypothetical protein